MLDSLSRAFRHFSSFNGPNNDTRAAVRPDQMLSFYCLQTWQQAELQITEAVTYTQERLLLPSKSAETIAAKQSLQIISQMIQT